MSERRRFDPGWFIPIVALGLGTWIVFEPELRSGLRVLPTGPIDMRLIGHLLEHGFLWVSGDPAHARFWDAPYFFPLPNVTAYSESFLGAAPLYWMPRWFGADQAAAQNIWLILQMALNFAAFAWFLRSSLRLSMLASAAGAYLFAFGGIRLNQLGHAQVLAQFYTVVALQALWWMFRRQRMSAPAVGVFAVATVLQVYAGVYLAWFFVLALTVATVVALVGWETRASLLAVARGLRRPPVLLAIGLAVVIAAPLAWHYRTAAGDVGLRDFAEVRAIIPSWRSWINWGPAHWLYGDLYPRFVAGRLDLEWEHRIGLGLIAGAAMAIGYWQVRRERWAQVLVATSVVLVALAFRFRDQTLWSGVFYTFPAAGSIRAVSRIALLLLIPASIGFALCVDKLVVARHWVVALALSVAMAAEQYVPHVSYASAPFVEREEALRAKIEPACQAFVFTPTPDSCDPNAPWMTRHLRAVDAHLDAMGASNRSSIPTLNGYSGSLPPRYPFWGLDYCGSGDDQTIANLIQTWCARNGCNPKQVCWIR